MTSLKALILPLIGLAVLAYGAYFFGKRFHEDKIAEQQAAFSQQLQAVQAQLDSSQSHSHLFRARLNLYRIAADIKQGNFNLANLRLQEVVAELKAVKPGTAGIDVTQLGPLHEVMAAINLTAAMDVSERQALVEGFGEQLDAILPEVSSQSAKPAPSSTPAPD